jgi:hypothetical protein
MQWSTNFLSRKGCTPQHPQKKKSDDKVTLDQDPAGRLAGLVYADNLHLIRKCKDEAEK